MSLAQTASAYGAGVLTSLSPCVYPMLPITLGFIGTQAGSGKSSRVALFALGQTAAFIVLGIIAVQAGEVLGFTSQVPAVRGALGILLLLAGGFSLAGRLPGIFRRIRFDGIVTRLSQRLPASLAAFVIGFGGALVMSPCTTPVLSSVLALIATDGSLTAGVAAITAYGLGFSTLILVIGLGVMRASVLPKSGVWMVRLHKAGALAMLGFGAYYLVTATA